MSSSWMQFQEKDTSVELAWHKRYATWLDSWDGTPYMHNMSERGVGVDCVRFAMAALDFLHGYEKADDSPSLPADTAANSLKVALEVVRYICRRYDHDVLFRSGDPASSIQLQPADVVVTLNDGKIPCHIMVGGVRPNTLWHSTHNVSRNGLGGVTFTGLGWALQQGIYRIWRPTGIKK